MCVTLVPVPVPEYSVSVPVYDAVRDDVVHDLPALAGRRNACVFVLVGRESLLETQGDLRFSTLRFSLRPWDEREPALLQPPSLSLLALLLWLWSMRAEHSESEHEQQEHSEEDDSVRRTEPRSGLEMSLYARGAAVRRVGAFTRLGAPADAV